MHCVSVVVFVIFRSIVMLLLFSFCVATFLFLSLLLLLLCSFFCSVPFPFSFLVMFADIGPEGDEERFWDDCLLVVGDILLAWTQQNDVEEQW